MAPFFCKFFLLEDGFNSLGLLDEIPSGKVILDVGSNDGTSINMIRQYFPSAVIWAFDPVVSISSDDKNIIFCNYACGDVESSIELFIPTVGKHRLSQYSSTDQKKIEQQIRADLQIGQQKISFAKIVANIVSIDSLALDTSFLKIDVEGFELNVLRGAKETIQRNRPIIVVEINDSESFKDINKFLSSLSYKPIKVTGRRNPKFYFIDKYSKSFNNYTFIAP
jgi:FkbM family methyltransferase